MEVSNAKSLGAEQFYCRLVHDCKVKDCMMTINLDIKSFKWVIWNAEEQRAACFNPMKCASMHSFKREEQIRLWEIHLTVFQFAARVDGATSGRTFQFIEALA